MSQKRSAVVRTPATAPVYGRASFPYLPFLMRATVAALWVMPAAAQVQAANTPVEIHKKGSDGRNAGRFTSSKSGGKAANVEFQHQPGTSMSTTQNKPAISVQSMGGKGGNGHNGVVFDSKGSRGGNGGDVRAVIGGGVANRSVGFDAHGVVLGSSGGNAGSRMQGGQGGGSAGQVVAKFDSMQISTFSSDAAGLLVRSDGGRGGSGYEAVGIRSSGSHGGAGAKVDLKFSGTVASWGRGIDVATRGGAGGGINGGIVQTANSAGGTGGKAGGIYAAFTGQGNGKRSEVSARGTNGHAISLLSQGGDGGQITGTSWANGADGGKGGAGGDIVASVADMTLTTSGAGAVGVLAQSDGGNGFWGGGSALARGGKAGAGADGGDITLDVGRGVLITTKGAGAAGVKAVSRGGGGSNGARGGVFYSGGAGSQGGKGGEVRLTSAATISTAGADAFGVYAASLGGAAGHGGKGATVLGFGGQGGAHSTSASVTLTNSGSVTTKGAGSHAIFAESIGGDGGSHQASTQGALGGDTHSASPDSHGDLVKIVNTGDLKTEGDAAAGILAQSIGGGGGNGGSASGWVSVGGDGQSSGNGGAVRVQNAATITTSGKLGYGVHAQSIGGGGGKAGKSQAYGVLFALSVGGRGDTAGDGGTVDLQLDDTSRIETRGEAATAVVAQSIGGGGGDGGEQSAFGIIDVVTSTQGGAQGASGHGGLLRIRTDGRIDTWGQGAGGVLAQSIGGGGGTGGNSTTAGLSLIGYSAGGNAGDAGHGGVVTYDNWGAIKTRGANAGGVLLQSVGGGGGAGGNALTLDYDILTPYAASLSTAIGGTAGVGGNGGQVIGRNYNAISTAGHGSRGLVAQSIGGGGGAGGSAKAIDISGATGVAVALSIAIGRQGGEGGKGGKVELINAGSLVTEGDHGIAAIAQSVGGGGGVGGAAIARSAAIGSQSFAASLALGGGGGSGGAGGDVSMRHLDQSSITTSGDAAIGVLAQSVGGGGGNGGMIHGDTYATTGSIGLALGRSGGHGGDAGNVSITHESGARITTQGVSSDGIVAQSIAGGGGAGGMLGDSDQPDWPPLPSPPSGGGSPAPAYSGSVSLTIGASGGGGGNAGKVDVDQAGDIETLGRQSAGLIVQSVGGGGGRAGSAATSAPGGTLGISLVLGGSGGGGGAGSAVRVANSGAITTRGAGSTGMLLQSIGGGGGNASSSEGTQAASKISVNVALGGRGGAGSSGGEVVVNQTGSIVTSDGHGLVAQSIGGGGGLAGSVSAGIDADATGDIKNLTPPERGYAVTLALGAAGGSGAAGSRVEATNSGLIQAGGDHHSAVTLQSIGGGGGIGGMATTFYKTTIASKPVSQLAIAVGGRGGPGGDGGEVSWKLESTGQASTGGDLGDAIRLQSIGSGGGVGASSFTPRRHKEDGLLPAYRLDTALITVGGRAAGGGDAAEVTAVHAAGSQVYTQGVGSIGLLAQSIGGGGGISGAAYHDGSNATSLRVGGGSGAGKAIAITQAGTIATQGNLAHGILAQSIGGGGGVARTLGGESPAILFNAETTASGGGNVVQIGVAETGVIQTAGDSAYGIFAQSVGGGGGYASSGALAAAAEGVLSNTRAGSGNGGAVTVDVSGNVTTRGAHAPAIFAQSVGGGGGWADGIAGRAGTAGSGTGGPVTVKVSGQVQAVGTDASGIFAQSTGSKAGKIHVHLQGAGRVTGGSGDAAGVHLSAGAANVVEIDESARLSALSGIAIRTQGGNTQVNNRGVLQGSILMDQTTPGLVRNFGLLLAGSELDLAGGTLNNYRALSIGPLRERATTVLKGNYVQDPGANYRPTVDYARGQADLLTIEGSTTLGGKLAVLGLNHQPTSKTFTVLDARGQLDVDPRFHSESGPVFDYPMAWDGQRLTVGLKADFSRSLPELAEEQAEVAKYLGRRWQQLEQQAGLQTAAAAPLASGSAAALTPVFDAIAMAKSDEAYGEQLDQIANDALQAPVAIMPLAHRMFINRSLVCPTADGAGLAPQDQACAWGDVMGSRMNRHDTHHNAGFQYDSVRYMLGGQHPLGKGWVAGGGVSYENARSKADDASVRTDGHSVSGVAFLRKHHGAWTYTGALSGGYGSYDSARAVATATGSVMPSSDWKTYFAALRGQVAYTHQAEAFYVRPALDVDVIYQRVPSYSETGGGAFNLAFDGASEVRTLVNPSIEIGHRFDVSGAALRPFMSVGVSWMPDNEWNTEARLKSGPSNDGFRLSQDLPDLFGEYQLGLEVETKEGFMMRTAWRQRLADGYNDHSAELRLGMRF